MKAKSKIKTNQPSEKKNPYMTDTLCKQKTDINWKSDPMKVAKLCAEARNRRVYYNSSKSKPDQDIFDRLLKCYFCTHIKESTDHLL